MKISKVLSIVVVALILVASIANVAYAIDPGSIKPVTVSGASKITSIGGKLLNVIQIMGSVVAVLILVVLGIKYMMGSTEEKAEYKKTLIPYIIGAALIFAASNIASMVYNSVKGL